MCLRKITILRIDLDPKVKDWYRSDLLKMVLTTN